jgi:hypothetical protein
MVRVIAMFVRMFIAFLLRRRGPRQLHLERRFERI